jgi:hypothetical protein
MAAEQQFSDHEQRPTFGENLGRFCGWAKLSIAFHRAYVVAA